jgi:N-acyl-D-amino-acid deacylase
VWAAVPVISLLITGALLLRRGWDGGTYDVIVEGGRIFNGETWLGPGLRIGIRKGRIVKIGKLWGAKAKERLRADGRVVSPGFIDTHVHIEASMGTQYPLRAQNFVAMGATTLITGNCGISHKHLEGVLKALDQRGGHTNLATLVGHKTLRELVMGSAFKDQPSAAQLRQMEELLAREIQMGALGFSTGLEYSPGVTAGRQEIQTLAAVSGRMGGLYATHLRNEGTGLRDALKEAVETARGANVYLHVSHLKIAARRDWGQMPEILAWLDAQRPTLRGLTADAYAYDASSSGLDLMFPPDFRGVQGSRKALISDPSARTRFAEGVLAQMRDQGFQDFSFAQIAWTRKPELRGNTLDRIPPSSFPLAPPASAFDSVTPDPILRQQLQVLFGLFQDGGGQMIYHVMDDRDVATVLADRNVAIGSDSSVRNADQTSAHPRGCGNFPRILGTYVRERHLLTLEEALRKMTSLPADIFGLQGRGRILPGHAADLVIFDPATIADRSTYLDPLVEPAGIDEVVVNGVVVVDHGRVLSRFPGQILRKPRPSAGKGNLDVLP